MKILIQRVKFAEVLVRGEMVSRIGKGLFLLVGFSKMDDEIQKSPQWRKMIDKILQLRVFSDDQGKLNLNLMDIGGEVLVVSQFTLYGDMKKGKRPSFSLAAPYDMAKKLYNDFVKEMEKKLHGRVKQGIFGEEMEINLCNFGPVTLMMESESM